MAFFKYNDRVEYESTRTDGRMFKGVVVRVDGNKAIIRHETEPKLVPVTVQRLRLVPRPTPTVHKGRTA